MTVRNRRRVSTDNVLSLDGALWELDQGYLAGQIVTVASCFAAPDEAPWVEHENKRLVLRPLDAIHNAHRKRPPRGGPVAAKPQHPVDFDPLKALGRVADSDAATPLGGDR